MEAAEASSRSAEREILSRRFFLRTQTREAICGELASLFSFAPAVPKKKWGIKFVLFNEVLFLQQVFSVVWEAKGVWFVTMHKLPSRFSLGDIGAREKLAKEKRR